MYSDISVSGSCRRRLLLLQQGEMVAALASPSLKLRKHGHLCSKDNSVAASPCLLRYLLLAQCAMDVNFSLALVALHCIAHRLLAYILVTAGSRQISSDLLATLAALTPWTLCMLSGVLLPVAVTIKGCTKGDCRSYCFHVCPRATLKIDFLFNMALVLLATNAAIQVCAQPFVIYASESTIHEIWGSQPGVIPPLANPTSQVMCLTCL